MELAHIAALDANIRQGRLRIRRQISLIRELRTDGHSTLMANELLHELLRSNRVMREVRAFAVSQLA